MPPHRAQHVERRWKDGTANAVKLNREICDAADRGGAEEVLALCSKISNLSLVNISTALHRVACASARLADDVGNLRDETASNKHDVRVLALQQQAKAALLHLKKGPGCDPHARCLSTISWACAKLQIQDPELMKVVCELSMQCVPAFKPLELSNLLWSLAKQRFDHRPLFQLACDHVCSNIDAYSPRSISMLAWAFATARFMPSREALGSILPHFLQRVHEDRSDPNPVVLVNIVWALATIGVRNKREEIMAIGDRAAAMLDSFKHYELSITLWAFAKLGVFHGVLFAKAAKRFCVDASLKKKIHTQGFANSIWAFAKHFQTEREQCHVSYIPVLVELLPTYKRLIADLLPMELSSILWAASFLVSSYRSNAAADYIMISAAEGPCGDPKYISQLSLPGEVSLLGAYVRFFRGWQGQAPEACSNLIRRLLSHCRACGLELGDESDVLATLDHRPELADFTGELHDDESQDSEATYSRDVLQRLWREASSARNTSVPTAPSAVEEAPEVSQVATKKAGASAAAHTAGLVELAEKVSLAEPKKIQADLGSRDTTSESRPVYITDSISAIDAWKWTPSMASGSLEKPCAYISVIPERSCLRCDEANGGFVNIAFEAAAARSQAVIEVMFVAGRTSRRLLLTDIREQNLGAVRFLRVSPREGEWELQFTIKARDSVLAMLKVPFVGRIPRTLQAPGATCAVKDSNTSAHTKDLSRFSSVNARSTTAGSVRSLRSLSDSGRSDISDSECIKA
eukprot:TRINITY_DN15767_c0_g1_i1.p1 TRINITY_DN15767_c0_g1~~TRINITY_DN15767_c0_g1_i1.p1  ORF type:complete len:748 (-),score=144.98 TRINITY_DN15767_c0_g1_i1:496-2739(-)